MWIGVLKTPTLGGRRFHWIGDWCVQHTNPWWQEVPLNWGLVCSTHQRLVAGGSTGMGWWCVEQTNPWWQENPLDWGLV